MFRPITFQLVPPHFPNILFWALYQMDMWDSFRINKYTGKRSIWRAKFASSRSVAAPPGVAATECLRGAGDWRKMGDGTDLRQMLILFLSQSWSLERQSSQTSWQSTPRVLTHTKHLHFPSFCGGLSHIQAAFSSLQCHRLFSPTAPAAVRREQRCRLYVLFPGWCDVSVGMYSMLV